MKASKLPSEVTIRKLPATVVASLGSLYHEFHKYHLNPEMHGDPAFPNCTDNSVFINRPLRGLQAEDFRWYFMKAMTTWGTVEDFKHFLPRWMELLALSYFKLADFDLFSLVSKLQYADWLKWPKSERESVSQTFAVLLDALLIDSNPKAWDPRAFELLVGIASIVDDVSDFLQIIDENRSAEAQYQLAYFFLDSKDELLEFNAISMQNDICNEREQSPQGKQIAAWLRRKSLRNQWERAFFNCEVPEIAKVYSDAAYWHEVWTGSDKSGECDSN